MAIFKCSECGGQVSTLAEKCPHCGCPVNSSNAEATANNSSASASVPTPSNSSNPKNRKLIWSIFAVIVAAIVGVALYFAVGSKSDSEDAAKTYAIGDYYKVNGKEGVVFEVRDNGRHGKIVSLDQTFADRSDANDWCNNKGEDWYLPAVVELKALYDNKSKINSTLAKYGAKIDDVYWSSTESESRRDFRAWAVCMTFGDTKFRNKDDNYYVRAVSAF